MEKRIVMVTGSGMGIGLACAEAFAREGATVIMADIQKPEEQARKLIDAGYDAKPSLTHSLKRYSTPLS